MRRGGRCRAIKTVALRSALLAKSLLLGGLVLPFPVSAALEGFFIYFPERALAQTPAAAGLPFEDVIFTAADGTTLHGWYLPGAPGQPLVLFCHGNAGNISHRVDNLKELHQRGFAVFIFDYRGYGRSEGRASEAGTYSDARGALGWLQENGWESGQMIYFGRSLGAAIALQLALDAPPAALVLESAFTSLAEMGRFHYPLLWRLGGWLLEARYANSEKIGRLHSPVLIIHGERDGIVPLEMGRELDRRAPEPKRFYPIPGAGHNDTYEVGGAKYWRQWQGFIDSLRLREKLR